MGKLGRFNRNYDCSYNNVLVNKGKIYFIDFDYYEKFEEQFIGARYIKNRFGPTPVEFLKITEDMVSNQEIEVVKSKYFKHEQTKYLPHRTADLDLLTGREMKHPLS